MDSEAPLSRRDAERIVAAAVEAGGIECSEAERLGSNLASPGVLDAVLDGASESKRRGKGDVVSVSRNLFIPLTNLCRDRCAYCTFAKLPDSPEARTYTLDDVAEVVRGGLRWAASRRSSVSVTSRRSPTARTASGSPHAGSRPRPSTWSRRAASPSKAACCPTPTPASSPPTR